MAPQVALRHLLRRGGWRKTRVVVAERPIAAAAVERSVWQVLGPIRIGAGGRDRTVWDVILADGRIEATRGAVPELAVRESPLTALRRGVAIDAALAAPAPAPAWTLVLRYLARDLGTGAAGAVEAAAGAALGGQVVVSAAAAARRVDEIGGAMETLVRACAGGTIGLQAAAVAARYLAALAGDGGGAGLERLVRLGAAAERAPSLGEREDVARLAAGALRPFEPLAALAGAARAKSPMARTEEEKLLVADWQALIAPWQEPLEAARRALLRVRG